MVIFKDFTESALTICEDRKQDGYMRVKGPFQKAETRNANGRIYPSSLWEKVLGDESIKNTIESKRMLGCVEHPSSGVTSLADVSHIVTSLKRNGNEIIGEAEVLNTPSGLIIQELLRRGVPVGISSRGRGSAMTRNGVEYVNPDDFVLETFDFVYKPSTPGAFPELQESVLAGSPFAKNSPMSAKIDQIRKFDVRTVDITEKANGKLELSELHDLHKECVEIRSSFDTIVKGMNEDENKEHAKYVGEVSQKIENACSLLGKKLDRNYTISDLGRRVDSALLAQATGSKEVADMLKGLLGEAKKENTYLRDRLEQLLDKNEAAHDDISRRYDVVVKFAEETLAKLQETTSALAELTAEHDGLQTRYEAAVELVAGVTERQSGGKLARLVQDAVEKTPELAKFQKSLQSCKTENELEERVGELVEGLSLSRKPVFGNKLNGRLSFAGAVSKDSHEQLNESVSLPALPKKGLTETKATRGNADKILKEGAEAKSDDLTEMLLSQLGLS